MKKLDTVVIVGGGLAGATAAFALREQGFDRRLVLVSEEADPEDRSGGPRKAEHHSRLSAPRRFAVTLRVIAVKIRTKAARSSTSLIVCANRKTVQSRW